MKASTIRLVLWAIMLPIAGFCVWQFVTFVFRGGKEARTNIKNAKQIHEGLRPPTKQIEQIRREKEFYKVIADVNVSGVAPKVEEKATSQPVDNTPKVVRNPLDSVLGLHGVGFDAEAPSTSVAFVYWKDEQIGKEDRKKTILREGSAFPKPYADIYKVKSIRPDSVIFSDEKGAEYSLVLVKSKTGITKGSGSSSRPAISIVNTPRADYAPPSETVKKTDSEYWLSPKDHEEISDKGLEMIGRDVHAVTYYDTKTKRPSGLRVARMRPDSLPAKLGLKESDIVREVNGSQIRSTADVYEYAKQNPNVKEVVLSVERFGRVMQITYVLPR